MFDFPSPSPSTFTPEDLGILLQRFRNGKDPKDHVYDILGLIDQTTRSGIAVNYDLPTAHVFGAAFSVLVQQHSFRLPHL